MSIQRLPLREEGSCIIITKAPNGYIITDGTRGDYAPRHLAVFNHMPDLCAWLMEQQPEMAEDSGDTA